MTRLLTVAAALLISAGVGLLIGGWRLLPLVYAEHEVAEFSAVPDEGRGAT